MKAYTFQQKQNILANLIKLSQRGEPCQGKLLFMQSIALKMQVTREELATIIDSLNNEERASVKFSAEEQAEQFYMLISLVGLHGQPTAEEKEFCRQAGINLGIAPEKVNEMLRFFDLAQVSHTTTGREEFVQLFAGV